MRLRVLVSLAVFLIVSAAGVTSAQASVTVTPGTVGSGTQPDLTFHVVNQQAALSTTQVQITFPVAPTVATATASSPPGWSSLVDEATGQVATITFNAGTIPPGGEVDFTINTLIPTLATQMTFKIAQTYSDGSTTVPDTATVSIVDNAPPTTAPPSTTSTTFPLTSLTTSPSPGTGSTQKSSPLGIGRVLIAIGAVLGIGVYLRIRRSKR